MCISFSTTQAELVAMSRCVQEVIFIRKLMKVFELDDPVDLVACARFV